MPSEIIQVSTVLVDFFNVLIFANGKTKQNPMSRFYSRANDSIFDTLELNTELLSFLEKLKTQDLYLLTSSYNLPNQAEIKPKLLKIFKKFFFSKELGYSKSDPRCYQAVLKELRIDPRSVLFIDDSPSNVEAAMAAGLQTILFQNNERLIKELQILKLT